MWHSCGRRGHKRHVGSERRSRWNRKNLYRLTWPIYHANSPHQFSLPDHHRWLCYEVVTRSLRGRLATRNLKKSDEISLLFLAKIGGRFAMAFSVPFDPFSFCFEMIMTRKSLITLVFITKWPNKKRAETYIVDIRRSDQYMGDVATSWKIYR